MGPRLRNSLENHSMERKRATERPFASRWANRDHGRAMDSDGLSEHGRMQMSRGGKGEGPRDMARASAQVPVLFSFSSLLSEGRRGSGGGNGRWRERRRREAALRDAPAAGALAQQSKVPVSSQWARTRPGSRPPLRSRKQAARRSNGVTLFGKFACRREKVV